jgi:hypothetical protein
MICAMRLHDPCDGRVHLVGLVTWHDSEARRHEVPLCSRHNRRWHKAWRWPGSRSAVPFGRMSGRERDEWAAWAAARAKRQEGMGQAGQVAVVCGYQRTRRSC